MGAYSYAATLLPQELSEAIDDFRVKFAASADQRIWEFGPSERGHALVITAEWHDELRPLAQAVVARAPDLPRWRFFDARTAKTLEKVVPLLEASRGKPMTIATMDVRFSRFGAAFASVKIAQKGGRYDEAGARHEREDAVHHELGDAGGVTGGAHAVDRAYPEAALIDIAKGIEAMRAALRRADVPKRMDPVRRRRVARYCAGHLARDTGLSLNPLEVACKQHLPPIS
ncbi:MAG: hypothetical protein WBH14_04890 [Albidovulum sp.]